MGLHMQSLKTDDIPVSEMREGQIGQITAWGAVPSYVGTVIKRVEGDHLFSLTTNLWWSTITSGDDHRVRLLKNGTVLTVVENCS